MTKQVEILPHETGDVLVGFDYSQVPAEHRELLHPDALAIRSNLLRAVDTGSEAAVERFLNKLKHFTAVATRYHKHDNFGDVPGRGVAG